MCDDSDSDYLPSLSEVDDLEDGELEEDEDEFHYHGWPSADTDSSSTSDMDMEEKKKQPTVDEVCASLNLSRVYIKYTNDEFKKYKTFEAFCTCIRKPLCAANPKVAWLTMLPLAMAYWHEFQQCNPFGSDSDTDEDELPAPKRKSTPASKPSSARRTPSGSHGDQQKGFNFSTPTSAQAGGDGQDGQQPRRSERLKSQQGGGGGRGSNKRRSSWDSPDEDDKKSKKKPRTSTSRTSTSSQSGKGRQGNRGRDQASGRGRGRGANRKPNVDYNNNSTPSGKYHEEVPDYKSYSSSEIFRRKGNEILASVNATLAPVLQESRLQEAMGQYRNALISATTAEKMSALKNLGVVAGKLARCPTVVAYADRTIRYLQDAVGHFTDALNADDGTAAHPKQWIADIEKRLYDEACCLLDKLQACEDDKRKVELVTLCPRVSKIAKSRCYIDMAQMYFRQAINHFDKNEFRASLQLFGECHFPLREALRFTRTAYKDPTKVSVDIIEDFSSRLHVMESAARAVQAIHQADEMRQKAVFNEENINFDLLWDSIDLYQQAIIYSADYSDLESEAIASTRIGLIYLRVMKLEPRGHERLKHAYYLAMTMTPRKFDDRDWFKQCLGALQESQEWRKKKEDEENAKLKAPYLEKLKDALATIKEKSDRAVLQLLRHVYEVHPPKNNKKLPQDIPYDKMKKTLRDALIHYHPDKNLSSTYGMEWFVLSEEICKHLSYHYENTKG